MPKTIVIGYNRVSPFLRMLNLSTKLGKSTLLEPLKVSYNYLTDRYLWYLWPTRSYWYTHLDLWPVIPSPVFLDSLTERWVRSFVPEPLWFTILDPLHNRFMFVRSHIGVKEPVSASSLSSGFVYRLKPEEGKTETHPPLWFV